SLMSRQRKKTFWPGARTNPGTSTPAKVCRLAGALPSTETPPPPVTGLTKSRFVTSVQPATTPGSGLMRAAVLTRYQKLSVLVVELALRHCSPVYETVKLLTVLGVSLLKQRP